MLTIVIPEWEDYDPVANEFTHGKATTLHLEHSLLSISKWESKWKKAFLGREKKSVEETLDYIRCMTLGAPPDANVYKHLTIENLQLINEYIDHPMTATTFSEDRKRPSREIVTSEIIYYWMVSFNIPFECQKWHLNRLLTLIRVCSIKNAPPKKMSSTELMKRNRALNEARKKAHHTKG